MAFYLVHAKPKEDRLSDLRDRLLADEFINLEPFGNVLSRSLKQARIGEHNVAWWEEEDYCTPPLREEREAVLDNYFEDIEVKKVKQGEGWAAIEQLPCLFEIFRNREKESNK